jgi:hypothetical protein
MKKNRVLITLFALSSSVICPMDVPRPFTITPFTDPLNRLVHAIGNDDSATVNLILSRPDEVTFINKLDAQGRTALTEAASRCNEVVMVQLFAAGADANLRNREGNTPLMLLATSGVQQRRRARETGIAMTPQEVFDAQAACMPALKVLLEHGADANLGLITIFQPTPLTPLVLALRVGNRRIADGIIQFIPASDLDTLLVGCASMNRLDREERPVMPLELRRDALCDKLKEDVLNAQMARIGYMNLGPQQKAELVRSGYTEDVIRQKIREGIDARMRTHKMPKI